MSNYSFLNNQLSKPTSIFGLRLWVVLGICVGAAIVIVLFLISLWFTSRRNSNKSKTLRLSAAVHKPSHINNSLTIPNVSKEIQEIPQPDPKLHKPDPAAETESQSGEGNRIHIEIGKDHRISYPERASSEARSGDQGGGAAAVPEVSHLGWGHWYTLRELEVATNGFADENVIGEGGYGIVYSGIFEDNTQVAVKNLLNNRFAFNSWKKKSFFLI